MEVIKWIVQKEKQLKVQLDEIQKELQEVEIIKSFLEKNYFNNDAQELFVKYIINTEAYCNWTKVNENGVLSDPNESLMRNIEESIGISENAKKAFREEILIRMSAYSRKGKRFDYTSYERLREAIEKSL